MRNPLGCLVGIIGVAIVFFIVALFGFFTVRQSVTVPPPRIVHLSAEADMVQQMQRQKVEMDSAAAAAANSRMMALGGVLFFFVLLPVLAIVAIVFVVRAASGPAPAPGGGPTVFDLALTVHHKLESCDARIERLESRLLARYDAAADAKQREAL